ncbi:MAG: protein TolR [Candidatus Tectimicrobiota bacterium]|nr:MAG: protein TolR [Candidatus Tectomicrobia bacterium]
MVSGKTPRTALAEINVTPLVDVMLVLLIIFMITAPMLEHEIDVQLPAATSAPREATADELVLTVTKAGQIYLNQTPYALSALKPKLQALAQARPTPALLLRADAEVPYGVVVNVIAAVKQAGIDKLGIVTRPLTERP